MRTWHTGMRFIIVNMSTGAWAQQSYVPDPNAVIDLNQHEIRNGRPPCYVEFEFTSSLIRERNKQRGDCT